ncbi:endonuclease/exonuclease/phosphatase family protein [Verrucomicrobia bacterium]|jgi:maltose 6'-phosphate phosphatase|nr:endonuclease/exonuclease/phosphatase family protein [Verrucomicrobiota bacterium]MDA7658007.1 endonuclease/exonuclease/phosphatase family protein [Verrucomicrobiota bacterium]
MKTLLYFFSLMVIVSCGVMGTAASTPSKTQIKVAAYNVEVSRSATAEEIGETLKRHNFDIVVFSEAPGGDWTKRVGKVLGLNHVVVGKYTTARHKDKYKTIVSRTPLYDCEEILMVDTLHTVTEAKTKIDGHEFVIYSVHFPFGWRDQAHIDETTGKITAFINHLKGEQNQEISVVMGDFNFVPSNSKYRSQYYEMMVDIGLDVSWKELGIDVTKHNTHNAYNVEDEGSGKVIDHIMYNPEKLTAINGQIIEMEKPLSDHKPVWAELQLKR